MQSLQSQVVACERCERLTDWCQKVAVEKRAAFSDQEYWGKPVPGFGDPKAKILFVGLAPAAHGANRTGRMFTGDRSGDFLYAALFRAGLANQPQSVAIDDGLALTNAWITAIVRCAPPANKPTVDERDSCLPWLKSELELLKNVETVICLGAFAWDGFARAVSEMGGVVPKPKVKFAHGGSQIVELNNRQLRMLGCYHPSQQNTFTGRITTEMIDRVLKQATLF